MIAAPPQFAIPDREDTAKYARWLQLCRHRLLPFVKHTFTGDYIVQPETFVIVDALERLLRAVQRGEHPRLMIITGPRVGKSELVSRMFPAWVLGQEPDWHVGVVSYGDDLAWELSSDAREIVKDEPYGEIFGSTFKDPSDPTEEIIELDENAKSVKHWKIKGRRGGLRSAGINGSLTGKGYKIVCFDDPTKGRKEADSRDYRNDQWTQYKGTFYPRLERSGNGVVVIGTAWHVDDILGRLQKENLEHEAEEYADHWEIVHIPAQAIPGHYDPLGRQPGEWMGGRATHAEWEQLKANTEPREWAAQYQGTPQPEEGQIFHPYEDFAFEDPPEDEPGKEYRGPRYAFADTSHAKNRDSDYSAILVAQIEPDQTIGILDVYRRRVQYPELKADAKAIYAKFGLWGLVIEDYSSGRALAQEFKRDSGMKIVTYRPDTDKYARAHTATGAMSRWKVRLPKGDRFPSGLLIRVFLEELSNFQPGGEEHDDMVDVFTMCMISIGTKNQTGQRQIVTRDFAFE